MLEKSKMGLLTDDEVNEISRFKVEQVDMVDAKEGEAAGAAWSAVFGLMAAVV